MLPYLKKTCLVYVCMYNGITICMSGADSGGSKGASGTTGCKRVNAMDLRSYFSGNGRSK